MNVIVVFFLLVDSPESEFYVPKFRNTLVHLHRWSSVPKRRDIKFRRRGITKQK